MKLWTDGRRTDGRTDDGRRTTEPAYTISSPGALGSGELKIGELPPLLVRVPLLIVNNYSEFQVNIFSNNRDIRPHLENSESKRGITFVKKIGGLPPLLVWVPLLIVNNYSEFQVNIFSNNRDIRKCLSFCKPPTTTPGL